MKKIELNDYSILYKALLNVKAKYNPKLLKMLKKDIYNLVITNEKSGNLIVTADIEDKILDKVEVVIGVGVKDFAISGVIGLSAHDIFKDIVLNEDNFLSLPEFKAAMVQKVIPKELSATSGSLPFYKYIQDYPENEIPEQIKRHFKTSLDDFLSPTLKRDRKKRGGLYSSITDVLKVNNKLNKQLYELALLTENKISLEELKIFLSKILAEHPSILKDKPFSTDIKRIIKIYDFLKYKKESLPTEHSANNMPS